MKILHCFQWKLNDIRENLDEIKRQGFDMVLTSPLQPHKKTSYNEWYMLYQPEGFRVGNDIGSKEDLKRLCKDAKEKGLRIMVDIVCNHTANAGGGELSMVPSEEVDKELVDNKYFWKPKKIITDWNDRWQLHNYSIGLPGLDTCNHDLQDIVVRYLDELIDCGVTGFRFDAARHIGLPSEGCDFFSRVLSNVKRQDLFCMGEVLNCSPWEIEQYSNINPMMKVLTNVGHGEHNKKVVFAESHDTFLNTDGNGYTRHLTEDVVVKDYIELCKVYNNVLYYTRPFSNMWKDSRIKYANSINR